MTYVNLGKKTGIFLLISLFVLVSLLFTPVSASAEENVSTTDTTESSIVDNTDNATSTDNTANSTDNIATSTDNTATSTDVATTTDNQATTTENTATSTDTTENSNNDESDNEFKCEIEGHKYDQNGNPLPEWQIGLMKIITQGENTDIWDLANDLTDSKGYYCLEWDGETRVFRGEAPKITTDPYDFTYHVYEKLVNGWSFLSIEKGPDINNLSVVDESDTRYDGQYVSTQVGEVNGYIYSDAAYHVDFYNSKNKEEEVITGSGSGGSSSSGSGTRVGDRKRSGGTGTKPEPKVLGEATSTMPLIAGDQVSVMPAGAPNTGAGGTANTPTLTLNQVLYISKRDY